MLTDRLSIQLYTERPHRCQGCITCFGAFLVRLDISETLVKVYFVITCAKKTTEIQFGIFKLWQLFLHFQEKK